YAVRRRVRILLDAEYTYLNPALSLVTMTMMAKFNSSQAWIWNTYQCYLKAVSELIAADIHTAAERRVCFGLKLVRGAYMDKERASALTQGRSDPIAESWEATNISYQRVLDHLLELSAKHRDKYRVIVATHNEHSVQHTLGRMRELNIEKDDGIVCFGQLMGMCDHVSVTLGMAGYMVYKSLPYGAVDTVIPYLVRRAQENQAVLQGVRQEQKLLRRELRRRFRLPGARTTPS
ncbi:hydroxyproline dehydrogenase-like, partial [Callorhinchus milii]|uniref:hydroxyproline dehydrogenase-like n=1 Tax=Callorhinchus milii TaxID=7868 RepID=UPI001C3F9C3C